MKALIAVLTLASLNAFAYEPGVYTCKNANPKLPSNSYDIKSLSVDGATIPYIQAKRYVWDADANAPLEISIEGLASVSKHKNSEFLSVNQFRLEFHNGELVNCKQ